MNGLLQDVGYAFRQFRKAPGFAFTAVISLMLGIGATTAIFSVIYAVLIDPYPYQDADRMVHVQLNDKQGRGPLLMVNGNEYPALGRSPFIDDVFLQHNAQAILTGEHFPISVEADRFSANLFSFMGVPPLLGREFGPADVPEGKPSPVTVLSYLFWKRQFNGDKHVLGKNIELDHKLYTVIGVVPPRFTWGDADVYLPGVPSADPHEYWLAFVKLKPGVNHKAAADNFQSLLNAFTNTDPNDFRKDRRVQIVSLNEEVLGKFSGTLVLLFVAVVALLVIGCANVSILLLARGTGRQHELAMRVSIGASRQRLIRQLLTESLLLSFTGAGLGVFAAYFGVNAIASFLPTFSFPHEASIHVNFVVLGFSVAVALITGILFGMSPAWELSRPSISQLLQAGSTRHSGTSHGRKTHRFLIAGQVTLTLLLLAGAGAATKAFLALMRRPLGFDPDHLIGLNVALPKGAKNTWEARLSANEQAQQTIEQVPGVTSVSNSLTFFPPFGEFTGNIELRSQPTLKGAQAGLALVGPQEFATLHIPLVNGRLFDGAEVHRGAHVAVVNRTFVNQFLDGHSPIGERVRSPALKLRQSDLLLVQAPDDWLEIIGTVEDTRNDGLDRPIKPAIFLPYSFLLPPDQFLFVRTSVDPEAALVSIKDKLRQFNPEMVVSRDHPMDWWLMTQGWGQGRFVATLFSIFAVLALALAATGLYSVVSYAATQRTQEVGIRMALGAQRGNILTLVVRSMAVVLGIGVTVGISLSVVLSKTVASWAGGGSPRDPVTLVAASVLLMLVAAIACLIPAWRAAKVDPMVALRYE
ncbi:MAG TPA: ABC transporter permease [Terriglobales bacterium]|nr:ABC transporter permease [Terriglobales bacterium]